MYINAAENYMPPNFIIGSQEKSSSFFYPQGLFVSFHSSGWIQTSIFDYWFHFFFKFTKPTEDKPVLLLFDGYDTYIKNIEFIEKARKKSS